LRTGLIIVEIPPESRVDRQKLLLSGYERKIKAKPAVRRINIHLTGLYGFALDIGTTKLAGYLVDLNSGRIIAATSMMNPQIAYGEDVISRIKFASEGEENLKALNRSLIEGINKMIDELCGEVGISHHNIYDMTVAGNTAMHHIFLGIPPNYLAQMPYPSALQSPIDVKAREAGVKINSGAYIHVLPVIAGFVGGDAVADALATEIYEADEVSMLIDIGTNTEIILGDKEDLIACSCASGPAFEGAHIKCGMRASNGAIEHVWIKPGTFEVGYKTIGDEKPRGRRIKPDDIRMVYLAGAFGNYIDPQNAKVIGMYPDVPLERVRFVGNTAGSGARAALISMEARKTAERIAKRIRYVELGADPAFQDEFLKATYLPHRDPERFPTIVDMLRRTS